MPQSCGYFWIWGENMVLQERYTHPALHRPEQDGAPSFTHIMGMGHYWYFPNCHLSQSSWLGWIFGKWPSVKKSHHFQLCKQDACNYFCFLFYFFLKHFVFWVTVAEMVTLSFRINQNGADTVLRPSLSPCLFPPHPLNLWWITMFKNLYLI